MKSQLKASNYCKRLEINGRFMKFRLRLRMKCDNNQWWILGEASEAIASGPSFFTVVEGPPFENAVCSFILWYFTWFHEPQKLSKV